MNPKAFASQLADTRGKLLKAGDAESQKQPGSYIEPCFVLFNFQKKRLNLGS